VWDAVEHDRVPVLQDRIVVVAAGEGEFVGVGGAAVDPVGDVVHLGAGGGFPALGERAALVAGHQGEPLRGGREPAGAAVGQDAAGLVEHHGQRLAVGGQPQRFGDADAAAVPGGGLPGPGLELLQRPGDHQGGRDPGGAGQFPGSEEPFGGVLERVVPALPGGTGVRAAAVVRASAGERFQDGFPQRVAGRTQMRGHVPGTVRIAVQ